MSAIIGVMAWQPGHESRDKPARLVLEMMMDMRWPVSIPPRIEGVPYNCGHSKNLGVRNNPGHPHDVLLLMDADCVTGEATLREMVWSAYTAPGIVWAGTEIRILDQATTDSLETWRQATTTLGGILRPCDATPQLLAIRRDCFETVGGYDEAYVGYGFEDYDFRRRCELRWPSRRAAGHLVHMWHEPDPEKSMEGPLWNANRERYERSLAC